MSNISKKGNKGLMLPEGLSDMTFGDLLASEGVEIHKKDNVLKLKKKTPSETVMVEVRKYDDTNIVSESKIYRTKPFSQMKTTIAQLRKEGRTQAEVAEILGTTQTNISKIEKQMKNYK